MFSSGCSAPAVLDLLGSRLCVGWCMETFPHGAILKLAIAFYALAIGGSRLSFSRADSNALGSFLCGLGVRFMDCFGLALACGAAARR
jgi:hypothetical protein